MKKTLLEEEMDGIYNSEMPTIEKILASINVAKKRINSYRMVWNSLPNKIKKEAIRSLDPSSEEYKIMMNECQYLYESNKQNIFAETPFDNLEIL